MKIIFGNILDTELSHIAHGCNTNGVFNSGVAKAIRDHYPHCYKKYVSELSEMHEAEQKLLGHDIEYFNALEQVYVHNVLTQSSYGYDHKKYASYGAVYEGLRLVMQRIAQTGHTAVAIPAIGCGRGGLKWELVQELLQEIEEEYIGQEFWVYFMEDEYVTNLA